jgi:hypothetical protein
MDKGPQYPISFPVGRGLARSILFCGKPIIGIESVDEIYDILSFRRILGYS